MILESVKISAKIKNNWDPLLKNHTPVFSAEQGPWMESPRLESLLPTAVFKVHVIHLTTILYHNGILIAILLSESPSSSYFLVI